MDVLVFLCFYFTSIFQKKKEQSENQLKDHQLKLENGRKAISDGRGEIAAIEKQIEELQAKRDAESGGCLQELETQLKKVSTAEAKMSATLLGEKEALTAETKQRKQVDKNVKDDEKALSSKKAELDNAQSVFDALQEAEKQDSAALIAAQQRFEAVSSGLVTTDEGENATLQDQLICKTKIYVTYFYYWLKYIINSLRFVIYSILLHPQINRALSF